MMDVRQYYEERKNRSETGLKSVRKKSGWIAFLRLLTMVLLIYSLVKTVNTDQLLWYSLTGFWLVAFIALVSLHRKLGREKDRLTILVEINTHELRSLNDDHTSFEDGTEYLNSRHEFTFDLDIFGNKSLFQYLNRTCTREGKNRLARDLLNSPFQKDQIIARQDIYKELAGNPDWMQEFRSTGKMSEDSPGDKLEIMEWLGDKPFRFTNFRLLMMYTLPALFALIIIPGILIPYLYDYLIPLIIISFLFNGFWFNDVNRYHQRISRKHEILSKYLSLNNMIAAQTFIHPVLQGYKDSALASSARFGRLDRLMNLLDSRLNMFVGVILNILLVSDLHLIRRLEKWRKENKETLDSFFMVPAFMDSAISFATHHFNNPDFCWPEVRQEGLAAQDLGHPLIHREKRVVNDFLSDGKEKIFLVTGANMAGKSTFLRTLGVNMILAGAGAKVCSRRFSFEPLAVVTGMRTTDSLADSESYFFAELKRLKKIVDMLDKGDKILILLDEILKGTNSTDKHTGSVALIKKFAASNCLVLVATHDLSLGYLADEFPGSVSNCHFESFIRGDELKFDYRLRKGLAQNMNASFLLQKMGIIDRQT